MENTFFMKIDSFNADLGKKEGSLLSISNRAEFLEAIALLKQNDNDLYHSLMSLPLFYRKVNEDEFNRFRKDYFKSMLALYSSNIVTTNVEKFWIECIHRIIDIYNCENKKLLLFISDPSELSNEVVASHLFNIALKQSNVTNDFKNNPDDFGSRQIGRLFLVEANTLSTYISKSVMAYICFHLEEKCPFDLDSLTSASFEDTFPKTYQNFKKRRVI